MSTPPSDPTFRPTAPEPEIPPDSSKIIADLAGKMQFVGLFTLIMGVLILMFGVGTLGGALWHGGGPTPSALLVLIEGAIFTAFGHWTRKAGREFQLVDETRGKDVTHVLVAVINLTKLYTVQYWLCIGGIVLFALVVVFAFTGNHEAR